MNKALLLVLGVVVVASLAVGGLLGAVVAGGGIGGGSTGTDTPVSSLPTVTATPTDASTPSPTPTATPSPTPAATPTPTDTSTPSTPTATPTPTVGPRESFDRAAIERLVREFVNDRREAAGLDPLAGDRDGADPQGTSLNRMARDHSVAMADAGTVAHELNGRSSADRYRTYELYRDCQWPSADGARQVTPDDATLEAVGRTLAGTPYEVDDGVRVNANETQVARAIVENWWLSDIYNERLSRPGATQLGVGVEITRTGEVYVTATLCG